MNKIVRSRPMPNISVSDINRFWSKVAVTANPDKCWNWQAKKVKGYGEIGIMIAVQQCAHIRANRLAYFIHYNIDPVGKAVLHKCDNPACVNPHHLFLGTTQDNVDDKIKKGRVVYQVGSARANAKLTEQIVSEIREKFRNGIKAVDLEKEYGMNQQHVSKIVNRKTWKHV